MRSRYVQYLAALSAASGIGSSAMYLTWSSPSIPILLSDHEDNPLNKPITTEDGSWIASATLLASGVAAPLVISLVELIGRKKALLVSAFLLFIPWIAIGLATELWMIIVARFVGGIGLGIVTTTSTMYNGEISDNDIRGKIITSYTLMRLIGNLIILAIGPFVSFRNLAIIGGSIPVISFISCLFIPESPFYLVKNNKNDEARKVLNVLGVENVEDKMVEIQKTLDCSIKNKTGFKEFFVKKEYRRVIFIMTGVKTLQQMCGSVAIDSYMQSIIKATGSSISPEISSIIFGVVQFPAAFLASAIVDKLGRKPILIISAVGCALALAGEGVYFYLQDFANADVSHLSWLPTTGLVLFLLMSTFGVFNLPYVLLGELFPTNIKGVAVSFFTSYGSFLGFFISKMFQPISSAWGTYTVFWIFTGFCLAGAIFVYIFLPETKGKDFNAIQQKIAKKNFGCMEYNVQETS